MRWNRSGVLALVLCLLVAGLIGALTPEELPSSKPVAPGADGTARTRLIDARVLDVTTAREVTSARGQVVKTKDLFVVVTFQAQNFRDTALLNLRLHTTHGLIYHPLHRHDIVPSFSVPVGQRLTSTAVFELPADQAPRATLTIQPHVTNGVSPVVRTPTFTFPDPLPAASGPIALQAEQREAAR